MTWQPIETAPKDGTKILAHDLGATNDSDVYITAWVDDVYTVQGGKGGLAGWFSGNYDDHWDDRPNFDKPVYWMPIPPVSDKT